MVDRYAKFGTEHLFAAASRIELGAKEDAAILRHDFPAFRR